MKSTNIPDIHDEIDKLSKYLNNPDDESFTGRVGRFDDFLCQPEIIEILKHNEKMQQKVREINNRIVDEYTSRFTSMAVQAFAPLNNALMNDLPLDEKLKKDKINEVLKKAGSDEIVFASDFQTNAVINHISSINNDDARNLAVERYIYTARRLSEQGDFFSASSIFTALTKLDSLYEKTVEIDAPVQEGQASSGEKKKEKIKVMTYDDHLSQQAISTRFGYVNGLYDPANGSKLLEITRNYAGRNKILNVSGLLGKYAIQIENADRLPDEKKKEELRGEITNGTYLYLKENLILSGSSQGMMNTVKPVFDKSIEDVTKNMLILKKLQNKIDLNKGRMNDKLKFIDFDGKTILPTENVYVTISKEVHTLINILEPLNSNGEIESMQEFLNRYLDDRLSKEKSDEYKGKVLENYQAILEKLKKFEGELAKIPLEERKGDAGKDKLELMTRTLIRDIDDCYKEINKIVNEYEDIKANKIKDLGRSSKRKKALNEVPFISAPLSEEVNKIYKYMEKLENRLVNNPDDQITKNKLELLKNVMTSVNKLQAQGASDKEIAKQINNSLTKFRKGYAEFVLMSIDPSSQIDVNELSKKFEKTYNKTPILIKKGEQIYIYGLNDWSYKELDAKVFANITFPDNYNDVIFESNISKDMRNEVKAKTGSKYQKVSLREYSQGSYKERPQAIQLLTNYSELLAVKEPSMQNQTLESESVRVRSDASLAQSSSPQASQVQPTIQTVTQDSQAISQVPNPQDLNLPKKTKELPPIPSKRTTVPQQSTAPQSQQPLAQASVSQVAPRQAVRPVPPPKPQSRSQQKQPIQVDEVRENISVIKAILDRNDILTKTNSLTNETRNANSQELGKFLDALKKIDWPAYQYRDAAMSELKELYRICRGQYPYMYANKDISFKFDDIETLIMKANRDPDAKEDLSKVKDSGVSGVQVRESQARPEVQLSQVEQRQTDNGFDSTQHTSLFKYLDNLQTRRLKHHSVFDVDHFSNVEINQYKRGIVDSEAVAKNKDHSQRQFAAFLVARDAEMHRSKLSDKGVELFNKSLETSIEWTKDLQTFKITSDGPDYYKKDETVPCQYHHASLLLYAKDKVHQGKESPNADAVSQLRSDAAEKIKILLSLRTGRSFSEANSKEHIEATQKEACRFLRHHPKFVDEQGLKEMLEHTERRLGVTPGLLDQARRFYHDEIKPKGK